MSLQCPSDFQVFSQNELLRKNLVAQGFFYIKLPEALDFRAFFRVTSSDKVRQMDSVTFIQMSKLPNVKGRISYITSHARQENIYATYRTADNEFWKNLAMESQQEFKRSGTEGKCIEARELIIALPEIYTSYEPREVL